MSRIVTVELNDATFTALQQQAEANAQSPAQLAAVALEQRFGAKRTLTEAERKLADERFERHFGAADLGHPTGVDNESIDADLARSYADTHEDE